MRARSEPTEVVLTADDFYAPLAGVRALRAAGLAPWVATHVHDSFAARSRDAAGVLATPDPETTTPAEFAGQLSDATRRIGARAVLPGTEATLVLLSGQEAAFSPDAAVGAATPDAVDRATDKAALQALAESAGLSAPLTFEVEPGVDPADELEYPAVLKPLRTAPQAENGAILRRTFTRRVEDADDLRAALGTLEGRWLVQPYLEGRLESVCGVAWHGETVCAQRHAAIRLWPPETGGSAYAESLEPDPELEAAVARIMAELAWSGLFQVQLIRVEDEPFLIDLNPRMWGSLSLALAAGQNLPAIWAELVLGGTPSIGRYRPGARFRAELKDVRALVRGLRGHDGHLRGLMPHRRTAHAVASWRDPQPLLALPGQLRRSRRRSLAQKPRASIG